MGITEAIHTRKKNRAKGWWAAFASFAAVLLVCALIVFIAFLKDADGNAIIENPGAVLVGFFALVGTIGTGVIAKLAPLQSGLDVIQQNVQNDHTKPDGTPLIMRDDLDDKHEEILTVLKEFQREIKRDIGGLREENRNDRKATNDRFDSVEERFNVIYKELKKH